MNAERVLGGLLRGAMGRGMRREMKFALGMGALGVAVAAFDHFMEQRKGAAAAPGHNPPAPPAASGVANDPVPPAAPPPPPKSASAVAEGEAALLIRAMIAAAHADGVLDEVERAAIVERLGNAGLSPEERRFLSEEMEAPLELDAVVGSVGSAQQAEQVYAVSLLAVRVDSEAERNYLAELADKLALPRETVDRLNAVFGV